MRQAGVIASAALFGLENNVDRLEADHQNAKILADSIAQVEGLVLDPEHVETNIVIFRVDLANITAADFVEALESKGVRMLAFSPQHVRAVTHLGVSTEEIGAAARIIANVAALM